MNKNLQATLADVFGLREDEVKAELNKDDIGTWDSLKQMDLVLTLEKKYDLSLEVADIVRMVSIAGIVEVLKEKGVSLGD